MTPHFAIFNAKIILGDKAIADDLSSNQLTFVLGESYPTTFTADRPTGEYN